MAIKSSGQFLASAARTATTSSAQISTQNFTGIIVYLDVTAASGTGGLTLHIQGIDPITGNAVDFYVASAAVTATGEKVYLVYPSASAGGTQAWSGVIPQQLEIEVVHGDATSYTYSASYTLLP